METGLLLAGEGHRAYTSDGIMLPAKTNSRSAMHHITSIFYSVRRCGVFLFRLSITVTSSLNFEAFAWQITDCADHRTMLVKVRDLLIGGVQGD